MKTKNIKKPKKSAKTMKISDLARKIQGVQTIESISSILNVSRKKAIYFIHRLREKGYVRTKYNSDKKRIYYISFENVLGGTSYIDILNKHSTIKLSSSETYKIYGRNPSIEETLVYAVKTRNVRYLIASLALFRKIKNWPELYALARKNNLTREIGALYDVANRTLKKLRRMDKRFRNNALPKKKERYRYLIGGIKSRDYSNIEKTWKIYIPLNSADLEEYKK